MTCRLGGAVRCVAVVLAAILGTAAMVPAYAEPSPTPSSTPSAGATPQYPSEQEIREAEKQAAEMKRIVKVIRAKLAAEREELERLQAAAALAGEQYNEARLQLADAKAEQAIRKRDLEEATEKRTAAQQKVTELARWTAQGDLTLRDLASILGTGPDELMDRASLAETVAGAMRSRLERARETERQAQVAARESTRAVAAVELANGTAGEAKRLADEAADAQTTAVRDYGATRDDLVKELASVQKIPVELAELRQEGIEAQERARKEAEAKAALEEEQRRAAEERAEAGDDPTPGETPAPGGSGEEAPDARTQKVIDFALAQVGEPYRLGAAGPEIWDCSGLTMKAWAAGGKSLRHFTGYQWADVTHIDKGQLRPGDLIFWANDRDDPDTIFHVALYLGDGKMVHAPRPGKSVEVRSIYYMDKPTLFGRP